MSFDTNIDKIKLIYEFNNDSPLFARVAESELQNGNADEALEILDKGLKKFPDYPTAYIVQAEVYASKGKYDRVIDVMEHLKSLIDDEETINYYLEKFEKESQLNKPKQKTENEVKRDIDSDLESIAKEISKAKIKPVNNEDELPRENAIKKNKETNIVSETLAGIYFSQGSYEEALEIYHKLLESNPNKKDFYKSKIDEIKEMMGKL